MTEPLFTLANLVKRYGEREACHIDSLEIYRGEVAGHHRSQRLGKEHAAEDDEPVWKTPHPGL